MIAWFSHEPDMQKDIAKVARIVNSERKKKK